MICPYITNTKRILEINKNYNGTKETDHKEIEEITIEGTKCLKDECGAWYNGRCQYKG